ncbi:MICOS complex subunit Mic60 isoform X1 [Ischnura elegans]|uniref:MICOS complex subunit Mic60 isoform X1 n=1 Tax=Ischnura elegans TaxID=197161 RepID=UPI001ED86647|nr:MICOS complex subunit Mic60 isoform X1 [Ischnura elegans]
MYSLLIKFRCRGLNRVPLYSPKRSQTVVRNSSSYGGSGGGGGRGLLYTIGGLTLVGGGTLAYAKYDDSFNKWLRNNVPYSEVVLDSVFKENYSDVVLDKIKGVTQVVKEKTADITQSLGVGDKTDKKVEESLLKKKLDRDSSKKLKDEVTSAPQVKENLQEKAYIPPKTPEVAVLQPPSIESLPILQVDFPHNPTGNFFAHTTSSECESTNAEIRYLPEPSETDPDPDPISVEGTVLPPSEKKEEEAVECPEPLITEKKQKTELPPNLDEMRTQIACASKEALAAYAEAAKLLSNHAKEVYCAIENSIDRWDECVWEELKAKSEKKNAAIKKAEQMSDLAKDKIEELRDSLVGVVGNVAQNSRSEAVKTMSALNRAGLEFKQELARATLTEQYRDRVEVARKQFETEFSTLLPCLKVGEKNKHVTADEFDLFTYHLCRKLNFYQKELAKLETLGRDALSKALSQRGIDVDSDLTKANINEELERQRRKLELQYQNAETQLRDMLCKQCKDEMKKAADAHAKHLADAVTARTLELERRYKRELDEQVTAEKLAYKSKLASYLGRLQGIDAAMKARVQDDENAHRAQLLWTACQALLRAIKAGPPSSLPWEDRLKPLKKEVAAIHASAPENDELTTTVLAGIPQQAIVRGVFPEDALRERFLKVEKVARKVALVGETGAALPVFLLSYLQSMLMYRGAGGSGGGGSSLYGIPEEELQDKPVDIRKLDTYDVLDRARYWIDRGDMGQALRYMNLLKGAPRVVAHDWIVETRMLLETKQVAEILSAHAFASSGHHVCPPKTEKAKEMSQGK